MRTIIRLVALLASLMGIASATSAGTYLKRPGFEVQENPNAITVMFVNGIKNTESKARKSSEKLIQSLRDNGLPQLTYNFTYFYNPTDGFLDDSAEVVQQARISDIFLGSANGSRIAYYQSLGAYYNTQYAAVGTLSGIQKRVVSVAGQLKRNIEYILTISPGLVIVPHSQANLYVEAAHAMLYAEGKAALLSKIRVAGVASAAATTPSDRYITHTSDRVIRSEYAITHDVTGQAGIYLNNFEPLTFNETACIGSFCGEGINWALFIDTTAHGFQEVYLNPQLTSQSSGLTFPKIIYDLVSASLGEIEGTGQPIIYQPANDIGVQDIWTTSVFSFTEQGGGPGGGLNDDRLIVGGWGDLYYTLLALNLNTLPTTASKVELQLYMPQARAAGTTALYLDRISAFWDWRTQGTGQDRLRLWWADRPTAEQWIATALPAPIAGEWYAIDITTLYNGWKAGTYPNYGIQLRPVGAGNNTWADFVSSNSADAAHRPRLVITP